MATPGLPVGRTEADDTEKTWRREHELALTALFSPMGLPGTFPPWLENSNPHTPEHTTHVLGVWGMNIDCISTRAVEQTKHQQK